MVDCGIIKGAFCHSVVSKGNIQLEAVVALAGQLPVQPLNQLFGLFCREVAAGNEEFIAAHPQGHALRRQVFSDHPAHPLEQQVAVLVAVGIIHTLQIVTVAHNDRDGHDGSLQLLCTLYLQVVAVIQTGQFIVDGPVLSLLFQPHPLRDITNKPHDADDLSLQHNGVLFDLIVCRPILPGHLGDKAGSLAGGKHLLVLLIIKAGLFLAAPDLQICLAQHILFLPFSVGEESPNVRNKKITAFRILEKEVRRCTAQKGHHFFVAERIDPLHPVAPPFHFSILLFYHILLYERCTCFASVNCAPSTIRKRATPPPVQTEKAADPSQVSGLSVCAYSAAFSCALWYCRVYSW